MRRSRLVAIAGASALAIYTLPLLGHHSLEDTYDLSRTVTLRGFVAKVEWANPHVRLLVEVKAPTDEATTWSVEIKPPSAMERLGMSAAMLQAGELSIDAWPAKDGSRSAAGKTLKTPDGTTYDVSSGLNWRPGSVSQ